MAALLRTLSEEGHTIFLCTHQLTEVAHLCHRIGVLVNGRMDHTASLAELRAQGHSATVTVPDLPHETAAALEQLGPQVRCDRVSVTLFPTSDALLARALRRLLDDGVPVISVVPESDALEQFYMRAVQHGQSGGSEPPAPPATSEELLETLIEDR
jgi:ABC-2 type transport system ATP-binding protein